MKLKASQGDPKKCLQNSSNKYPKSFSSWFLLLFVCSFFCMGAIFNIILVQLAQVATR